MSEQADDERWIVHTINDVARFYGLSRNYVKNWFDWSPIPCPRIKNGNRWKYDLKVITQWAKENIWEKKKVIDPTRMTDEELMEAGDGDGLERWRNARATMAEMDLEEKRRTLVKREDIHSLMSQMAATIKQTGTQLQKSFGEDALDMHNDCIEELEKQIEKHLEDRELD